MEFYAVYQGILLAEEMLMFEQISKVLRHLPDLIFDPKDRDWEDCKNQISCHLICRALAKHFDLICCDGYFTPGYQHSWLKTRSESCIIDAYPVAGGSPFIVAAKWPSPWGKLYRKSNEFQEKFQTPEFAAHLEQTICAVKETVQNLNLEPPSL